MRFLKALSFTLVVLAVSFLGSNANAQNSLGYRQKNLACNLCTAPNHSDSLVAPWGIAFLQGQNFFIAENGTGRVDSYDANGVKGLGVSLPLPAGSTLDHSRPTGLVAEPTGFFFVGQTHFRFFAATEEGTIVGFNVDDAGQPIDTRIVVDHSPNAAVYTGITLLHPACCNAKLAVANFHDGNVEVFGLSQTALPGAFADPNLPAGFAPYNVQTIGDAVFVTYAKQDAEKKKPVFGFGNGIVSVFNQDGEFLQRLISDRSLLDTPWGVTLTPATFGPFPGKVAISNTGNGRIVIYDQVANQVIGPITDGEGALIANNGIHGVVFRSDGVGDPDNLYFAAAPAAGDGLFGAVGVGRLTQAQLTATQAELNVATELSLQVRPLSGGDVATGSVVFFDGRNTIGTVELVGGIARLSHTYTTVGLHNLLAEYQGNENLLPSFDRTGINVLGPVTTTTLAADPGNARLGVPVTLTATVHADGSVPTGNVVFQERENVLGTVPLDGAGVARVIVSNLEPGVHSVLATYSGSDALQGSSSTPTVVVIGGDFQFTPQTPSIMVGRGRSTDVTLTVAPQDGFTGAVTFNCLAPAGITCTFNPSTVNVGTSAITTKLTVGAAANLAGNRSNPLLPFMSLGALGAVIAGTGTRRRRVLWTLLTAITVSMLLVACGGYGGQKSGPPPRTVTITLSATGGAGGSISHSATLNVTVQ